MNFKQFLNEYDEKSIIGLIANKAIPLEPGLMQRLGYYNSDTKAYHLTNSVHLPEMIKQQKKRNSHISTFTRGGPELARLPSQPNILIELTGDSVIEGDTDIWSIVSVRGRRWLDIKDKKLTTGDSKKLTFFISGVLQKVAGIYGIELDAYKDQPDEIIKKIQQAIDAGVSSGALYKSYLTNLEAMLNKQYKELNIYLKSAAVMKYNEIILDKWKITSGYCVGWERPDVVQLFKKHKIAYKGVILSKDFSKLKI